MLGKYKIKRSMEKWILWGIYFNFNSRNTAKNFRHSFLSNINVEV